MTCGCVPPRNSYGFDSFSFFCLVWSLVLLVLQIFGELMGQNFNRFLVFFDYGVCSFQAQFSTHKVFSSLVKFDDPYWLTLFGGWMLMLNSMFWFILIFISNPFWTLLQFWICFFLESPWVFFHTTSFFGIDQKSPAGFLILIDFQINEFCSLAYKFTWPVFLFFRLDCLVFCSFLHFWRFYVFWLFVGGGSLLTLFPFHSPPVL